MAIAVPVSFGRSWCALFILCFTVGFAPAVLAAEGDPSDVVDRGRYLVQVMDCGGCHDFGAFTGQPDPQRRLAGSRIGFAGPWGVVYPPNLTPDEDTGLGRWSDEQILAAVRHGVRPDGRLLARVMPWPSYSHLDEADGRALVAYLRSIPAVRHAAPGPSAPGERPPAPYLDVVNVD